ncbi:unnamed protein product, partial [Vitis vinifera]
MHGQIHCVSPVPTLIGLSEMIIRLQFFPQTLIPLHSTLSPVKNPNRSPNCTKQSQLLDGFRNSLSPHPNTPISDSGLRFRQKLLYIENLKVNSSKALHKNPNFRSAPLDTVKSVEKCLCSMGIQRSALGRILDMHPQLLTSDPYNDLYPVFDFLFNEVVKMVVRSPGLLTFSIEKNFQPKVEYFLDEMKGDLAELKRFPQYFSFSLEGKIKPRHRLLAEHGFSLPLPEMLKVSDGEFNLRLIEMRLQLADERYLDCVSENQDGNKWRHDLTRR